MGSPERGDDPAPRTVSDFFRGTVGQLLKDNTECVMDDSWDDQELRVLHLIDPAPPGGELLRYHYVYERSGNGGGAMTRGILMAWPRIVAGDHVATGETRHYFDQHRGFVVRKDVLGTGLAVDYEFLTGSSDPSEAGDPGMAHLVDDLHNDMLRIGHSEPLRPMSNLFRQFVMPVL